MNTTCAEVPKRTEGTQIGPTWYHGGPGRATGWLSIKVCKKCELTCLYWDGYGPCPECGSDRRERVGRWNPPVRASTVWRVLYALKLTDHKPFNRAGFWEVKP